MSISGWNLTNTYTQLPQMFFREQLPTNAPNPKMVIFNYELASSLGLKVCESKSTSEVFAGNTLVCGVSPIAQAYAGYQFGHFSMLGDGRAVLFGEQITPLGLRFDIQLKGSGPTPFSRGGDGLAALGPMLREYIISEAMFALGIPTTRSLAVVLTGKNVYRQRVLQGAVLTRVAASHIRVGTFNYAAAFGADDDLRKLADYCIWRHFEWLLNDKNRYFLFFKEVCKLQAALIAKWQLVGFVHGVMNTDNAAISGETIDYGPCAFIDGFSSNAVFSSIDTNGRYAYKNQPTIGAWNLARLAEELLPLFNENQTDAIKIAQEGIDFYWKCYQKSWSKGMRDKLGLVDEKEGDEDLFADLFALMETHKLDFTNTFREMSLSVQNELVPQKIPAFGDWVIRLRKRLKEQNIELLEAVKIMDKSNPAVIPRNHRVEEALAAAEDGNFDVMNNLLEVLAKPYDDSEKYSQPPEVELCGYKTFCGT